MSTPQMDELPASGLPMWCSANPAIREPDLGDLLALTRVGFSVVTVGDGLAPRTLVDAVAEGARAGATV